MKSKARDKTPDDSHNDDGNGRKSFSLNFETQLNCFIRNSFNYFAQKNMKKSFTPLKVENFKKSSNEVVSFKAGLFDFVGIKKQILKPLIACRHQCQTLPEPQI